MTTKTTDKDTQIREALDAIIRRLQDARSHSATTLEEFDSAMNEARQQLTSLCLLSDTAPELSVKYREGARNEYARDGEIEIDEGAIVSKGGDPGAYVQAWVWVANSEAGIEDDDEGDDGSLCPRCGENPADEDTLRRWCAECEEEDAAEQVAADTPEQEEGDDDITEQVEALKLIEGAA